MPFVFLALISMELKKSLGQHFLHDENMLKKIVSVMGDLTVYASVAEVGPGHGALTKRLLQKKITDFKVIEIDNRCVEVLKEKFPTLEVVHKDFLKADLPSLLQAPACIVGNFPYNVSTQIVFTIIDNKDLVAGMIGMFQKEVAQRIAAVPKTKAYGVMSILAQAYYESEYLLDVPPGCFTPPPKVMSGVVALRRKTTPLGCDEVLFKKIVKQSFTQRRKVLSNSLKGMCDVAALGAFERLRPEALSIADFVTLTNQIANA